MDAVTPEGTLKTGTVPPPLTASELAPGPVIATFWERTISDASVMVGHGGESEKSMVSPGLALATT
jgi:hypothetical protein